MSESLFEDEVEQPNSTRQESLFEDEVEPQKTKTPESLFEDEVTSSSSPVSRPETNPHADSAAGKLKDVKEGDLVAIQGRDGKVSLKKMNAPSDGASVLEDVDDVPDMNKTYPTLTADEWDAGRESGKLRMNVSPSRYRQLQHIAETGSEVFDKAGESVAADIIPFGGRGIVDEERSKIEGLVKLSKGDSSWIDERLARSEMLLKGTLANTAHEERREPTEEAKSAAARLGISVEEFIGNSGDPERFYEKSPAQEASERLERGAVMLGIDKEQAKRKDKESEEEYQARIRKLAEERAKHFVSRQDWAKRELAFIDKDWKDTVFGEGRASIGYGLEFAASVPLGGVVGGAAKGAPLLTRLGTGIAKIAVEAQPVALSHAASDYEKLRENSYTMKNGELEVESKGDTSGRALFKAIANNEIEAITEIGLGELTAPFLRGMGRVLGKKAWGRPIVGVAEKYAKIRDATKFGDILFEELPEENVQYFFSDVLGLGKKDSEYGGIGKELDEAFSDGGMYTLKGQWNTALAMLLQMGGQAALAAPGAGLEHIKNNRELANVLEGAGMAKEQVAGLSLSQREAFRRFHDHFADNPDKLKEALVRFDKHLGKVADELV